MHSDVCTKWCFEKVLFAISIYLSLCLTFSFLFNIQCFITTASEWLYPSKILYNLYVFMINWEAVYMINDALIHSISFNEATSAVFRPQSNYIHDLLRASGSFAVYGAPCVMHRISCTVQTVLLKLFEHVSTKFTVRKKNK